MNHLFVARHGDYDFNDRLDYYDRKQMEVLRDSIREILKGKRVKIISSSAPRALDSSEILIERLSLSEFEQIPYLWSGTDSSEDSYFRSSNLDRLMELVNERKDFAEGLVMITHLEVARDFSNYFLNSNLGVNDPIKTISKGQAVHIDIQGKTYEIIPNNKTS